MLRSARSPLGAPGAYALPDVQPVSLHPQRMDVAAFVGVAPRGPADVPVVNDSWPAGWRMLTEAARPMQRSVAVPVRSFDDYTRIFGGFEGPGALPHAVASYFEQGGQLAWIVRIVQARAAFIGDGHAAQVELPSAFSQSLIFVARNQGAWGNKLRVQAGWTTTAVSFEPVPLMPPHLAELSFALNAPVALGTCIRFTNDAGQRLLAYVDALDVVRDPTLPRTRLVPRFDVDPLVALPGTIVLAEVVQAHLHISDGAGRSERFTNLALSPDHPQSLVNVLCEQSTLVWPHPAWVADRLRPADVRVESLQGDSVLLLEALDHYEAIQPSDFFDASWSPASDEPGSGVTALAPHEGAGAVPGSGLTSVTQLLVPDLYVPAAWADEGPQEPLQTGSAGADFSACVDVVETPLGTQTGPTALTKLILDPRTQKGLLDIIDLQQQVVAFCEGTQALIALLDVPPGLSQARIEQWRARFDTSYAAAYHPWLLPVRRLVQEQDMGLARQRPLPPSAVAAGIVARREIERGIQYGPANELARQVIHVAEAQPEGRADVLHPLGINCFVREPAGIQLVAARTLSLDRDWRQLSVRRLMLMLRRTLLVETQWAVFEPNGPALWRDLQSAIEGLLRRLFQVGAFAGRTEGESFFVRVHTDTWRQDRGELLVEVGVAPAEPLEFILVRLRRDGDGTLNLED